MTCPNCRTEFPESITVCSTCKFPFTATDQEKSAFIAQQILKSGKISDSTSAVNSSRWILYALGFIHIVRSLVFSTDLLLIGAEVFLGIGFIIFGYLVVKTPMQILVFALSLLVFIYTVTALIDVSYLLYGLRWKVISLTGLGYSILLVRRAQKLRKESAYLSKIK